MQVKRITDRSEGEHSAILLTFIKLPFVIKMVGLHRFYCTVIADLNSDDDS